MYKMKGKGTVKAPNPPHMIIAGRRPMMEPREMYVITYDTETTGRSLLIAYPMQVTAPEMAKYWTSS